MKVNQRIQSPCKILTLKPCLCLSSDPGNSHPQILVKTQSFTFSWFHSGKQESYQNVLLFCLHYVAMFASGLEMNQLDCFRKDLFAKANRRIIREYFVWWQSVIGKAMWPETWRLPGAIHQTLGAKSDLQNDTASPWARLHVVADTLRRQLIYRDAVPFASIMSAIRAD